MDLGRATKLTAAGAIASGETILQALILTPGAAVATCDIKEGGSGGTVVISLQAGGNLGSTIMDTSITVRDPYLSAISGAGASLTVVM